MPMGHWSIAICQIDRDRYGIWHMTNGPLAYGSQQPRLRIVGADLHRESVWIHALETEAASLLVNRSGSTRLEIPGPGALVEVTASDRDVADFGCRITWPQDQKVFPKHELVVSIPFVHGATEHALVEIC